MEQENEQEFDIKGLLIYCLKRWYVFLLICALSTVAYALYLVLDKEETEHFQASITICDIKTYAETVPGLDERIVSENYNIHVARAVEGMLDGDNFLRFLETPAYSDAVKKLSSPTSATTKDAMRKYLTDELIFRRQTNKITVAFDSTSPGQNDDIKELLNVYITFMRDRAYENTPVFLAMAEDGIETIAMTPAAFVGTSVNRAELLPNIPTGFILGFALAAVIVLAIYFIDPKLKSTDEPRRYGFPTVIKSPDKQFIKEDLTGLTVKLSDAARILAVGAGGAMTADFCRALAGIFISAGYRVVWVDGSGKGNSLNRYFSGAKAETCLDKDAEIPRLSFSAADDAVCLARNKERLAELLTAYDKIIFSCESENVGAVAGISAQCEATVCVLDYGAAKTVALKRLCGELNPAAVKVGAVVYGCKE